MKEILTGKTQSHLVQDPVSMMMIHPEALHALNKLRKEAEKNNFSLQLTSVFRGFDQQLGIWNAKARGLKTLFDDQGIALDYSKLSPTEVMYAILRWSALPGASRHHWGTDMDVFDKSRMPEGYEVQLLPQESEPGGYFAEFHQWLDSGNLEKSGFYRPYALDKGGIAPEMWHLSYAPVSNAYQEALSFELIEETIIEAEIELKPIILRELPEIYQRFINI